MKLRNVKRGDNYIVPLKMYLAIYSGPVLLYRDGPHYTFGKLVAAVADVRKNFSGVTLKLEVEDQTTATREEDITEILTLAKEAN